MALRNNALVGTRKNPPRSGAERCTLILCFSDEGLGMHADAAAKQKPSSNMSAKSGQASPTPTTMGGRKMLQRVSIRS